MELESPPVYVHVEFLLQPDQAAPLSDVAEGSDEVGIDKNRSTHGQLVSILSSVLSTVNCSLPYDV
jgi:hypothetical protein